MKGTSTIACARGRRKKGEGRAEGEKQEVSLPPLSPTIFAACYTGYLYRGQSECIKLRPPSKLSIWGIS